MAGDLNCESINSLKKEIETEGRQCLSTICDVSYSRQIKKAIRTDMRSYNAVEILVSSAGILKTGSIEDTSDKLIDKIFNANVKDV